MQTNGAQVKTLVKTPRRITCFRVAIHDGGKGPCLEQLKGERDD